VKQVPLKGLNREGRVESLTVKVILATARSRHCSRGASPK